MDIALTTRWNASRHTDGQAMVEEILDLGFSHIELGYDLRLDLVEGVLKMANEKAVTINSVHNFCPVPMGAPRGHPELYTFAHPDARVREGAVIHTARTIEFAAEVGARVVVSHSGYIETRKRTEKLFDMIKKGKQFSPAYDKAKMKLQVERDKKAPKQLPFLYQCIERLLPVLEANNVQLALENLPTWEATPSEPEFLAMANYFNSEHLKYWHDIGHGQIRENLGFIDAERWLEQLHPHLAGMHLHDVIPPIYDHIMPPRGKLDYSRFGRFATMDIVRVIEPTPRTPAEEIVEALEFFNHVWS